MSSDYQNLDELIDACRGRSEDLQLPEMAALAEALETDPKIKRRWEKMQEVDESLGRSIRDVPIPLGLEARLLAALANQQPRPEMLEDNEPENQEPDIHQAGLTGHEILGNEITSAGLTSAEIKGSELVTPLSRTSEGRRKSRRVLWLGIGIPSAAVVLLFAFVFGRTSPPSLTSQQDVALHSGNWLKSLTNAWLTGAKPSYPLPQKLNVSPYRWQRVPETQRPFDVLCYEIQQSEILLFVCHTTGEVNLESLPPKTAEPATGTKGWWVGGWQEDGNAGLVFVLAVKGEQQYKKVLNTNVNLAAIRRTWRTRLASGLVSPEPRPPRT